MDLKTLLACFMVRHHRYRLADVKFTTSAQTCEEHGADESPSPKKPKRKAANPKAPKYNRLDRDKRIQIETLRDQGVRQAEIARIIRCAMGIDSRCSAIFFQSLIGSLLRSAQ